MNRARRTARSRPFAPADLTPMVDVVFLLIVFFVLVSQLTKTERTPIELPSLDAELLTPPGAGERVVVHVGADGYRIGARTLPFDPSARADLGLLLRAALANAPSASVVLRAPRDAPFERVAPALGADLDAGAQDLRLVARERLR